MRQWWITFGGEPLEARRMSDEAADRFSKAHGTSNKTSQLREQDTLRQLTRVEPGEHSKSFRRIMDRDFTGVVDTYPKNIQKEKWDLW